MRILYVSGETPIYPAGGIATYLKYIAPAMSRAGHEIFLFTWSKENRSLNLKGYELFDNHHVHIEYLPANIDSSNYLYLSKFLAEKIIKKVNGWSIDVIESTDYQAACLNVFQLIQTDYEAKEKLLVTYNHGLLDVVHEADQFAYSTLEKSNYLCERQQCRISDLIITPSLAAQEKLRSLGINKNIEVVREPYEFNSQQNNDSFTIKNKIQYFGRLSIQKGLDKIIYLANMLQPIYPLRSIELIGRTNPLPFRIQDVKEYVEHRICPELKDRLLFRDYIPRETLIDFFSSGSISPHLGSAETFSFSCIESIDAGLLPIVRQGSAMSEFFPDEYQKFVLDERMSLVHETQEKLSQIIENASDIHRSVKVYCQETLNPSSIAQQMGDIYDKKLTEKRRGKLHASLSIRPERSIEDITVLIPAFRPNHEFMETIDSIAWQSIGCPKVLICNDGTPESHLPWFDYAISLIPNCKIINQANSGLLAARNTLIEECDTIISIFLDTDDIFPPCLLEKLLEAWNYCPFIPDAVIPQRINFAESDEKITRHLLNDHLHMLENDYRMTALIRTEILKEIGFDSTWRNGEGDDWFFWLDFTSRGYKGILLPEQDFLYRFRKGSMSWPWSEGQHVGTQSMIRNILENMDFSNPNTRYNFTRAFFTSRVLK